MNNTTIPDTSWLFEASDLESLRKLYYSLALKHHPDRPGGDLETMQQINSEYEARQYLLSQNNQPPKPQNERPYKSYEQPFGPANFEQVGIYREATAILQRTGKYFELGYTENGQVAAKGPASYEVREQLKAMGFWWQPDDKFWLFVRKPGRKVNWNTKPRWSK